MSYPLSSEKDGIKIQPDKMQPETLYHCIYQNKVMLVYKDQNEILNCYEIDDNEIVSKAKGASNADIEKVLEEFGGKNFSTFKSKLSESIIEQICPIGNEIKKLLKDKNYLNKILEKGSKKADIIAKNNLKEVYEIIGLTKFT